MVCVTCNHGHRLFGCSLPGTMGTAPSLLLEQTLIAMSFGASLAENAHARKPMFAGSLVKATNLPNDFVDLPTHYQTL